MDVFFPFLPRPFHPAEPVTKLISPVSRFTRISRDEQHHYVRVGWRAYQQQSQQQPQPQQAPAPAPLLSTSHAVTPEAEQHTDAAGHLDIYI